MHVVAFNRVKQHFVTYRELADAFRAVGSDVPTPANIAMWSSRDAIPGRWVAPLMLVMARRGVDLLSLIVDENAQAEGAEPDIFASDQLQLDIFGEPAQ